MDIYKVGLDIGSTTAKIIVLDKSERNVLFYKYERHQAKVQECLLAFFHQLKEQMGDVTDQRKNLRVFFFKHTTSSVYIKRMPYLLPL